MIRSYLKFLPTLIRLRKIKVKFLFGSYADKKSIFEGNNLISRNCIVLNTTFGRYTYVNHSTKLSMTTIGRYSCIGPESLIGGLGIHPVDRLSTHKMFYSDTNPLWAGYKYKKENFHEYKRCTIGSDVWLGARVIVLDGVSIGDGAIVAAGSVVTKDVEAYSVVGGVPAKHIKYRFSEDKVRKLTEIKWWEHNIDIAAKEHIFDDELTYEKIEKLEKILRSDLKVSTYHR